MLDIYYLDSETDKRASTSIKESEPLEFRKFNIYPPTTVQGFWQKLVSDYGRPCFYQKRIEAAFKKIGMIPKILLILSQFIHINPRYARVI